jgi:hypothetical protein
MASPESAIVSEVLIIQVAAQVSLFKLLMFSFSIVRIPVASFSPLMNAMNSAYFFIANMGWISVKCFLTVLQ